jgi:hypothetical protein
MGNSTEPIIRAQNYTVFFFIKLAKSYKGIVMLKGVYINGTNQGYTAPSLKYVISAKKICSPSGP